MRRWKRFYDSSATFTCPYCLKLFPMKKATIDHVLPYSRFHDNSPENKVFACKECNTTKGALTAEEFELWKTTQNYSVWKYLEFVRNGGLSR